MIASFKLLVSAYCVWRSAFTCGSVCGAYDASTEEEVVMWEEGVARNDLM